MTRPLVLLVSDALGETAEGVARAALSQFGTPHVDMRRYAHVDSVRDLEDIFALALRYRDVVIVYTLVVPAVRQALEERASALGIPTVDVLGPAVSAFQRVLPVPPSLTPGLSHRLDREYFERVEAVDFAVRCDDGKNLSMLSRADVVVLGVSRSSKTPLCMYLAHRRVKAANVPLIPEAQVPEEVLALSPRRVVGLRVDPAVLRDIRRERLRSLGLSPDARYAEESRIREELGYAEKVYARIGCAIIDVTNLAVEETAARVLDVIRWQEGEETPRSLWHLQGEA